jgi:hypothetical protein
MSLPSTSWPIVSIVGKKTSKLTCPERSLAMASLMLLNVVTCGTGTLYFFAKFFRVCSLM